MVHLFAGLFLETSALDFEHVISCPKTVKSLDERIETKHVGANGTKSAKMLGWRLVVRLQKALRSSIPLTVRPDGQHKGRKRMEHGGQDEGKL